MNHIDPMISVALDRQAQKVRSVQAYGTSQKSGSAAQNWQMAEAPRAAWPVGRVVSALAMAAVVVGMLVVYVAR